MLRVRLIAAIVAVGTALAGCSGSSSSSLFKSSPPPTQALQFETVPPGADVRTTDGQTCRTPCSLAVPLAAQPVSFAMNGYTPQTVPVAVHQDNIFAPTVFAPNPVVATLQTVPKPAAKPKSRNTAARAKMAAKPAAPLPAAAPKPAQDDAFPAARTLSPVESRFPTLPLPTR